MLHVSNFKSLVRYVQRKDMSSRHKTLEHSFEEWGSVCSLWLGLFEKVRRQQQPNDECS